MARSPWLVLAALIFAAAPASSQTAQAAREAVVRDAERAVRAMMEAWAYDEHWKMWEMGTEKSQAGISQHDFADELRLRMVKPAAGKQVEGLRVQPRSEWEAQAVVRFSLENHKTHRIQAMTWTFPLWQDDVGNWRFDLGDFLELTGPRYW